MGLIPSDLQDSTRQEKIAAALILLVSVVYLSFFVSRGWIPHDEGMTGQAAERVLHSQLPHVDYQEAYTGGLTYAHAAVFKFVGVNVLALRWLLFIAATSSLVLLYFLLRRYLAPVTAALWTCVALVWSFPNYFAALPSWWLLVCALFSMWALARYAETDAIRFAFLAALGAGVATAVKQTGAYLIIAVAVSILFTGRVFTSHRDDRNADHRLNVGAFAMAAATLAFATFMLRSRLDLAELVSLWLPVAAVAVTFGCQIGEVSVRRRAALLLAISGGSAMPIALLLVPYVASNHVAELIRGTLVLPQMRLAFASLAMPPAPLLLAGLVPLLAIALLARNSRVSPPLLTIGSVIGAMALVFLSIRALVAYQLVWNAIRAIAVALPILAFWSLVSKSHPNIVRSKILFASSSMLAWASLNQFPFGSGIYFCYVVPLAVIAGVAVADAWSLPPRGYSVALLPAMLLFAIFVLNPGYARYAGAWYEPQSHEVRLNSERAPLLISREDANTYERIGTLVQSHGGPKGLMAGPDAPEVYFLAEAFNSRGTLFDFFDRSNELRYHDALKEWTGATVIVINHRPGFSDPLPDVLLAGLRKEFPQSEMAGRFEVRWR